MSDHGALETPETISKPEPVGAPADKAEAAAKARAYGFVAPTKYDYSVYGVKTGEDAEDEAISGPPAYEWASDATKYDFLEEYGDVGPRVPELEKQLYHGDNIMRIGMHLNALKLKVTVEGPVDVRPILDFDDAGLHPIIRENIDLCLYGHPTPIQGYCLPAVMQGNDVVACAQTGSGKTAAYLIPVLSKLAGKYKTLSAKRPNPRTFNPKTDRVRAEPLVLIVCPTRELAIQIFDETRRLSYRTMLRPCVSYGGGPRRQQQLDLQRGCDILISTPGRLLDFIRDPSILSLRRLKFTIIDEADEMLQGDWEQDMGIIMSGGDNNEDPDHQYMMFSATFPAEARKMARDYMKESYIRIRVGRAGSSHNNIIQHVVYVDEQKKRQALWDLLFACPPARTLVFVNSKRQADFIDDYLYNNGLPSTSIHSDRTQREREDAIIAFRKGAAPILVTTGVAARGLDIRRVMHVINYDLPTKQHGGIDEYVHRIGRTARIGNEGLATTFFNDRDMDLAEDLVKVLLECNQEVPDFLESYKPADNVVTWDDVSDASLEDDTNNGGEVGAWGASTTDTTWGQAETDGQKNGGGDFTPDGDFKADGGAGKGENQW